MRRKFSFYFFLLLISLAVISIGVAYRMWNKPHKSIKDAKAIEVTAVALYDSLANNNLHAKPHYVNKVVTVTGKVKRIMQNQEKQQVVLLETGKKDASINCTMEEMIKDIDAGEMLTIKGMCMGYSGGDVQMDLPGDVFLIRCYGL